MRLVHPDIQTEIVFDETFVQVLCMEDPSYYTKMIEELFRQNKGASGRFILTEEAAELSLVNDVELIHSPFTIDFGNKKLYQALYKEMTSIALNEEYYLKTQEVVAELEKLLLLLSEEVDYHLEMPGEYDLLTLIKNSGLKFSFEKGSLIDAVIDYIFLMNRVLKTRLFVLVNFHSFFSKDCIESFYETLILKKINVLLLENVLNYDNVSMREKVLVIDKDLCEITI